MQEKSSNEKKKYLEQYIKCKAAVTRIEEQIKNLESSKMFPGSKIITDMPMTQGDSKDLSGYAAKYDELVTTMKKARYDQINIYMQVFKAIELLEDETEKKVLTERYINGFQWEDICTIVKYEWAQIHRIHASGLKHIKIQ